MNTNVFSCGCKSDYQDRRYGVGMRLHNMKMDEKKGGTCTVCGKLNTKTAAKAESTEDDKKKKSKKSS